jgi:polyhydroxyalkanoate synthesis regulator phasin
MKISNGEIFNAYDALGKLFEIEFPVKTGLALSRLIGKLTEPYNEITRVKDKLVKKHGIYDGERNKDKSKDFVPKKTGNVTVVPEDETWESFISEYIEVMSEDRELAFDKVKIPSKIDNETLKIKLEILAPLERFIEVE